MTKQTDSTFALWQLACGFGVGANQKAAEALGKSTSSVVQYRHNVRPNKTTLLAMAAVRAGLEPWSPETDGTCVAVSRAADQ